MQGDPSLCAVGDLGGMGNHDDGTTVAVKVLEQGQDLVAGTAIQRAGRLVGQDESRIIHHCACNDDALLLASRELIRPVMTAVGEADPVERPLGSTSSFLATSARVNKGQFDIFQRAGPRQKRRNLKDETNILAPDGRAYVFIQLYNFPPLQRVFAAVRALQRPKRFIRVDFPEPERPRMAMNSPRSIESDTLDTARTMVFPEG